MKKVLLFALLLLKCTLCFSQSYSPNIEPWRGGFRTIDSKERIGKDELQIILDDASFTSYLTAHGEWIASIPLWSVSSACAATSLVFLGIGVGCYYFYKPSPDHTSTNAYPVFLTCSGIAFAAALLPAIPALILTLDSHKKLDTIATKYNASKTPVSLEMGGMNGGIGIGLNF